MMVEAGANEISEKEMLDAILFGHEAIKEQCAFIEYIREEVGKPKANIELHLPSSHSEEVIRPYADAMLTEALKTFDRYERQANQDAVEANCRAHFAETNPEVLDDLGDVLYKMTK